jgi:predicted thioesterase
MEKIDAQRDHLGLEPFKPGAEVTFKGKLYKIQRRTTLASGEAAVVLEGEKEQFVINAKQFLAGVSS